ncbi:hypothetical protein BY458DRAFT_433495 [Sporodiniella umbellata]|nr:hypothetical protein BY458DRAFT_433495 [Sporodiniella umbellata]
MPKSPSPADEFIKARWSTSNIHGSNNLNFVNDPIETNASTLVLKVDYPAGSYAPRGTQNGSPFGGAEFFSNPNGKKEYNTALLTYDVAFAPNFDWVKGGKLLGLYGGRDSRGCSGGEEATGDTCFSVRMMWRTKAEGEVYAYVPTSKALCSQKDVICHGTYGTSFSRGAFTFSKMKWSRIEIYIKMNSVTNTNGLLKVWQDNALVIERNVQYRKTDDFGVSSLMFSTFFGGGSTSYATPVNTSSYFKNIQLSTGDTPITNVDTSNSSARLPYYPSLFHVALLSFVVLYQFFV